MTRLYLLAGTFWIFSLVPSMPAIAGGEVEVARFLDEALAHPATPQTFWLTAEHKPVIRAILGHDYPAARLRYWRSGQRTAWVLEEIGKELPITAGIVIDDGRIERMRVLAYRESRGWEVQSPGFLRQFAGAGLSGEQQLDHGIDGISGATLSVRALTKLARLALWLHHQALLAAPAP